MAPLLAGRQLKSCNMVAMSASCFEVVITTPISLFHSAANASLPRNSGCSLKADLDRTKILHVCSASFRAHTGLRAALLFSLCWNFQRRVFKAHKPASKELEPYVDPPLVLQFLLIFPQLVFKVSNARPIHAY